MKIDEVLSWPFRKDSLISAENAILRHCSRSIHSRFAHIDECLQSVDEQLTGCNIADDKSSYFSLLRNRQALQQRKDAIKQRFTR